MAGLLPKEAEPIAGGLIAELGNLPDQSRLNPARKRSVLKVRTANECLVEASRQPISKKLFGELWYEGELCILFADTNVGKSIVAVQIGNSISGGEQVAEFPCEAQNQLVLYADFELTDKQFHQRYSEEYQNPFLFDEKFHRANFETNTDIFESGLNREDLLIESLEEQIVTQGFKVVIIDNLTYLGTDNERAKEALPLMKMLKALKEKYNLSMLVLAHTPKRDPYKPLCINDIQGSKMIANFCDSVFAIGQSAQGANLRYIKQIKVRAAEKRYGEDNVVICRLGKLSNFLGFNVIGFGQEFEHLQKRQKVNLDDRNQQIRNLKDLGKTNQEIADQFGLSESGIRKILKED